MKLAQLLEELKAKQCYKDFIAKNPEVFLTAGFFILPEAKFCLDFFLPKQNRIATAEYPFTSFKIQEDEIKEAQPLKTKIIPDICDLQNEIEKIKKNNKSQQITTKIIAILKDNHWNLTCLGNTLEILRIKINASTGQLCDFKKSSLLEFMKVEKHG